MATPGVCSMMKMVKDSSGKAPTHPNPCLMTCVGSTGAGTTSWTVHSDTKMVTTVDMSHCGFVDVPVVTTSLAGSGYHDLQKGVSAPWSITKTGFDIAVLDNGKYPSPSLAQQHRWHVNWIAVGYNCA